MAKDNRDAVMAFIFQQEGGFSADPNDPGNWTGGSVGGGFLRGTNFGIAANSHPGLDIANLTKAEASAIYKTEYWDAIGGDGLRPGEDLAVMDPAVNSGPAKALSWWRAAGGGSADAGAVIQEICAYRLSFMHALGSWSRFGGAWGRRVAACEALALQMLHGAAAGSVLPQKANDAHAATKTGVVKSAAGGGVAGAGAIAHGPSGDHSWLILLVGVIVAIMIVALLFNAWRQSQRGDALEATLKDWAAKKQALDAAQKAEAAQKAALQARIDLATAAEAALKDPTPLSATAAPSGTAGGPPAAAASTQEQKS